MSVLTESQKKAYSHTLHTVSEICSWCNHLNGIANVLGILKIYIQVQLCEAMNFLQMKSEITFMKQLVNSVISILLIYVW